MTLLHRDMILQLVSKKAKAELENIRYHSDSLLFYESKADHIRKSRNAAKATLAQLESDYARLLEDNLSTECEIALLEKYK